MVGKHIKNCWLSSDLPWYKAKKITKKQTHILDSHDQISPPKKFTNNTSFFGLPQPFWDSGFPLHHMGIPVTITTIPPSPTTPPPACRLCSEPTPHKPIQWMRVLSPPKPRTPTTTTFVAGWVVGKPTNHSLVVVKTGVGCLVGIKRRVFWFGWVGWKKKSGLSFLE